MNVQDEKLETQIQTLTEQRDLLWAQLAVTPKKEAAPPPADQIPTSGRALTATEQRILELTVDDALKPAEIAQRLRISPRTVKNHVQDAKRKLGARNTVEAYLIFDRWYRKG